MHNLGQQKHLRHGILMATAVVVLVWALGYILLERSMHRAAAKEAMAGTVNLTEPFAANMDLFIASVDRALRTAQERARADVGVSHSSLHDTLALTSSYSSVPINFGVSDADGNLVASSRTTKPLNVSIRDRDYFPMLAESDRDILVIGKPVASRIPEAKGEMSLPFGRALRDGDGRLLGLVVATVPVDFVTDFFSRVSLDGRIVVIRRTDGTVLFAFGGRSGREHAVAEALARAIPSRDTDSGQIESVEMGGNSYLVAWNDIADIDVGVFTAIEEDLAMRPWHDQLLRRATLFGLMAFGMLAAGWTVDRAREKRSRREQAASELSDAAFSAISDPLILLDFHGRVLLANQAARNWAPDLAEGQAIADAMPELAMPGRHIKFDGKAASGEKPVHEIRVGEADRSILVTRFPFASGILLHLQDVSELRRTENKLKQAQKMEAIGQLTGGVAHDFNNLLTVMIGNLDLICAELPPSTPLGAAASAAYKAADRAAELTSSLLAIGRRQPLSPTATDINLLVEGFLPMLKRVLPENIEVQQALDSDIWAADVDRAQLESSLLNLALNARDAMPEGGKLTIDTSNEYLDEDYAARHSEVVPGAYVLLAVSDTGTGIPASILEQVFDPFFTTKEEGLGSGLGLSMVMGFVKQTGGHVKIYSEAGEGTTVKLYLPRARSAAVAAPAPVANGLRGGDETVLLVEDDDLVRTHVASQIERLGYKLLIAQNGDEALELLTVHPVDLLLTDVMLPGGMNGRKLSDIAQSRYPRLRTIYMSGYTRNAIVHHGRLDKDTDLLEKPFRMQEIADIIRRVLDRQLEDEL